MSETILFLMSMDRRKTQYGRHRFVVTVYRALVVTFRKEKGEERKPAAKKKKFCKPCVVIVY